MTAKIAITKPKMPMLMCATAISWFGVAAGLIYDLYISNARIKLTAISSAEAQDVAAMERVMSKATAPNFPSKALATKAEASPAET
jgi:hypothetical protein